jgi:cation diffusion facilitator family transporter
MAAGRQIESDILTTNAWHHRTDALSSLAVLAGVLAAWIKPSWRFMDAYVAMGVSFFILKVAVDFSRGAIRDLTDTAPPEEMRRRLYEEAHKVEGVMGVHDFRSRTLGRHVHVSLHVEVEPTISVLEGHKIATRVESALKREAPEVSDVAVQVNPCGLCPHRDECHPKDKPF